MKLYERGPVLPRATLVSVCFPFRRRVAVSAPDVEVYTRFAARSFSTASPQPARWWHFHPVDGEDGSPAFAVVQEDGSFQLSNFWDK